MACIVLGEECGSSVNESGLMEQNIQMLKDLQRDLWACYALNTPTPWYLNPLMAWLFLFLGPALVLGTLLLLAPYLIQFLKQISSTAETTANQILVQYQTIPNVDVDCDDTAPLREDCGTLMTQGYRERVKGASTLETSNLRTA